MSNTQTATDDFFTVFVRALVEELEERFHGLEISFFGCNASCHFRGLYLCALTLTDTGELVIRRSSWVARQIIKGVNRYSITDPAMLDDLCNDFQRWVDLMERCCALETTTL